MAKIFKDKKIKEKLENFEIPKFKQKLKIIKDWYQAYQDKKLYDKTESQCEQAFNQDFFVDILDYTKLPAQVYTIDPKGATETSGQKPDAVLGHFNYTKRVQAVVEIKDVNTDLDKAQKRIKNDSPVQQAFKYKPQYKECGFVIVTNFFEIRLYRSNQLDFEVFTLEGLSNPKDDYFQFRKFYFILNQNNFISKSGKSKTEQLLSDIRIEQEIITKDFYKEYKKLRYDLIIDIHKKNKHVRSKEKFFPLAVQKAQKVIDRIVFICFCEDRDLLPEDTLHRVIKYSENNCYSIWDNLKGLFNAIDNGSIKLEIPNGYNGELFKAEPDLDILKIGDKVCKKLADLGKYDFSEEGGDLSVNILGHIFEQSISDIENLKNAGSVEKLDQKQTKRKKDGIFYTPDYIVSYIVENALGKYLEEKEDQIKKKHKLKGDIQDKTYKQRTIKAYNEYQQVLWNVKVLDPACGSGAFLVKVFDYLLEENKRVGKILQDYGQGALFNVDSFYKKILENNIYGVDLNQESVEITKLSLWLKTAIKGKKLTILKDNIKCGNSLIDDPEVAGEKAFKWEEEFKEIMKKGGFDVVVGNPPYVRIQNLDNNEVNYYNDKYNVSYKNYDIYVLFVEKLLFLLNKYGYASYIMPKKFIYTDYGKKLKLLLYQKKLLDKFIDFNELQIFQDATTYTGIFVFSKEDKINFKYLSVNNNDLLPNLNSCKFININYSSIKNNNWILKDFKEKKLFNKLDKIKKLKEVTGADSVYVLEKKGNKLFSKQTNRYYKFIDEDIIKPLLKGSEIKRYSRPRENYYLIFPYKIDNNKAYLIKKEVLNSNYPEIWSYLNECIDKLKSRDRGKMNKEDSWWAYSRTQNLNCFESPKIITQVLSTHSALSLDFDRKYYFVGGGTAGGYGITKRQEIKIDYKYLLGILNSKLLEWFIHLYASPFRGGFYAYNRTTMEQLPIIEASQSEQELFSKKINLILELNEKLQDKLTKFHTLLKHEYKIEKIPKKLEKFWELEFDDFVKALKIKNLSLDQKSELLNFFEKNKKELSELKAEIDKQDSIIDEMVFDLYGLTETEREIVKGD
jgi:hypothetical protein